MVKWVFNVGRWLEEWAARRLFVPSGPPIRRTQHNYVWPKDSTRTTNG